MLALVYNDVYDALTKLSAEQRDAASIAILLREILPVGVDFNLEQRNQYIYVVIWYGPGVGVFYDVYSDHIECSGCNCPYIPRMSIQTDPSKPAIVKHVFKGRTYTLHVKDASNAIFNPGIRVRFSENELNEKAGVTLLMAPDLTVDELIEAIKLYEAQKHSLGLQGSTTA